MTYGENATLLRTAMTTLLRQHRIQLRLGGSGATFPASTTLDQRRAMGEQIGRHRRGVLTWCLHAIDAAGTLLDLQTAQAGHPRSPLKDLRPRLRFALDHSPARLPTMAELTTAHEVPMVETWRQAARAACLSEHDLPEVGGRALSRAQWGTVIGDVAAIIEALAVLDLRYRNIPGWQGLRHRGRLARAAAGCGDLSRHHDLDETVDSTGWRPPPARVHGPGRPGIIGVVQAEHNLLLALARFPDALNLRRVLDSQRLLSHRVADLAHPAEPALVKNWVRRAETHTALVRLTRDFGGFIGNGGLAAAEGANAVSRSAEVVVGLASGPFGSVPNTAESRAAMFCFARTVWATASANNSCRSASRSAASSA